MGPSRRKTTPKKRPRTSQPGASTSTTHPTGPRCCAFPGTSSLRILQEIHKLQKSIALLIGKTPCGRLVREICLRYTRGVDFYWQSQALLALQEAAEAFIIHLFEDAHLLSIHARRVTVSQRYSTSQKDQRFARRTRLST